MPLSPFARLMRVVVVVCCVATVGFAVINVVPRLFRPQPTPLGPDSELGAVVSDLVGRVDSICSHTRCDTLLPPRGVVACLDRSGSVPRTFVDDGRAMLARHVAGLASGPNGGVLVYVRVLHAASYQPHTGLLRREIPPIGAPPVPPTLPRNPYAGSDRVAAQQAYADDLRRWLGQYERATEEAVSVADQVRKLRLPRTRYGTDVRGCLLRAQDLLAGTADSELVIVSDLKPQGRQSKGSLRLQAVRVVIAYWCTDAAAECLRRRQKFTALAHNAGAASVTFLDPIDLRSFA